MNRRATPAGREQRTPGSRHLMVDYNVGCGMAVVVVAVISRVEAGGIGGTAVRVIRRGRQRWRMGSDLVDGGHGGTSARRTRIRSEEDG